MQLFSKDIAQLKLHFGHHKLISSRVNALEKALLRKDELLDQFWNDYSASVTSSSLKHKCNKFIAEALVEEEAVQSLQRSADNNRPTLKAARQERSLHNDFGDQDTIANHEANEKAIIEYDGVYVSGSNLSVGIIIKHEAVKIHKMYADNLEACPIDDKKVMCNGLSSILDLCDQSVSSQYRYFNIKQ